MLSNSPTIFGSVPSLVLLATLSTFQPLLPSFPTAVKPASYFIGKKETISYKLPPSEPNLPVSLPPSSYLKYKPDLPFCPRRIHNYTLTSSITSLSVSCSFFLFLLTSPFSLLTYSSVFYLKKASMCTLLIPCADTL